ncbi:MAG: nucleoside triphosphate pyrophosphohydrolase [Bacteroidetes bacterium]|nr:MAG: nucleoside triphosphate pyrophosphohydrolase [Bacteroidota bacterium]
MNNSLKDKLSAFERLLNIMDDLRKGCPWDKEQTYESLRHLTVEETYELSEAIFDKDVEGIKSELGDLMLHIVFYAKIGSETGDFDMADVLNYINEKLIYRHPHIYGEVEANDAETVMANWEMLKLKEGRDSVLSGVPKSLPPLVKAYRIQEKVKGVGFDWEKPEQVWDKVQEEMQELKYEVDNGNSKEKMENELGDLMFSIINYARFIGVNPEDALEKTNRKLIYRFQHLEGKAKEIGKSLKDKSLKEMDVFWEEAKKME